MKTTTNSRKNFKVYGFAIMLIFLQLITELGPALAQAHQVKNIVLVHGAFADASGWKAVYNILIKKGYHVSLVQNPLSSLSADVTQTNSVIDQQDGPVVLVGHSWGGNGNYRSWCQSESCSVSLCGSFCT